MKYKNFILILFFFTSCTTTNQTIKERSYFSSKGFAYIYDENDYKQKIISKRFSTLEAQISHDSLKRGTLLKITNPENKKHVVLKINKRSKYPVFYKILITDPIANKINLNKEVPYVEIEEVKINKTFVAQKAKIFNEEKKIHSKAPVEKVKIDNLSKNTKAKIKSNKKFSILIGEFYSKETAEFLKNRLREEVDLIEKVNLSVKKINTNNYQVVSGRYISVNHLKDDYIKLKNYGFENLEINLHE